MHWNEQQTSRNWRLDRIKFWSQRLSSWSTSFTYFLQYFLLSNVSPVTRSRFSSRAHQCIGSRSDRTVGVRNIGLHLCRSVVPNSPDLNSVDYKLRRSCNSRSIRLRSRMWMNSKSNRLKSGLVGSRTLLTLLSTNGENVCVLVFARRADISNICCRQLNNWIIG